ncbi:unnamed protein product [Amoebophrya sp. A25]|nr:unnamed protein product [Amoebophrya sp. A25]|eukprot:GSA25T00021329001.1
MKRVSFAPCSSATASSSTSRNRFCFPTHRSSEARSEASNATSKRSYHTCLEEGGQLSGDDDDVLMEDARSDEEFPETFSMGERCGRSQADVAMDFAEDGEEAEPSLPKSVDSSVTFQHRIEEHDPGVEPPLSPSLKKYKRDDSVMPPLRFGLLRQEDIEMLSLSPSPLNRLKRRRRLRSPGSVPAKSSKKRLTRDSLLSALVRKPPDFSKEREQVARKRMSRVMRTTSTTGRGTSSRPSRVGVSKIEIDHSSVTSSSSSSTATSTTVSPRHNDSTASSFLGGTTNANTNTNTNINTNTEVGTSTASREAKRWTSTLVQDLHGEPRTRQELREEHHRQLRMESDASSPLSPPRPARKNDQNAHDQTGPGEDTMTPIMSPASRRRSHVPTPRSERKWESFRVRELKQLLEGRGIHVPSGLEKRDLVEILTKNTLALRGAGEELRRGAGQNTCCTATGSWNCSTTASEHHFSRTSSSSTFWSKNAGTATTSTTASRTKDNCGPGAIFAGGGGVGAVTADMRRKQISRILAVPTTPTTRGIREFLAATSVRRRETDWAWAVLELQYTSSLEEIRRAVKALRILVHPDKLPPGDRHAAELAFKRVETAEAAALKEVRSYGSFWPRF